MHELYQRLPQLCKPFPKNVYNALFVKKTSTNANLYSYILIQIETDCGIEFFSSQKVKLYSWLQDKPGNSFKDFIGTKDDII